MTFGTSNHPVGNSTSNESTSDEYGTGLDRKRAISMPENSGKTDIRQTVLHHDVAWGANAACDVASLEQQTAILVVRAACVMGKPGCRCVSGTPRHRQAICLYSVLVHNERLEGALDF